MMYKTYDRMDNDKQKTIHDDSVKLFRDIKNGAIV